MNSPFKFCLKALLASIAWGQSVIVAAAPVVVQKGSTAQYIYIPATSVGAGTGGGGANDGPTAAKQFCTTFVTTDRTLGIDQSRMLDPQIKIGAILVGGGSGSNYKWAAYDYDTGVTAYIKYVSGGGGGATAVLKDGVPLAIAVGADASTVDGGGGLPGKRVTAPEFTVNRAGAASTLRIVIGGGGGSGGPQMSYSYFGRTDDAWAGWGGRGYFGGGSGAMLSAPSDQGSGFSWPTPARGGSSSGGTGAVPPSAAPYSNRVAGIAGWSMNGGPAAGYGFSPNFGRIGYGQRVISWSFSVGYSAWTPDTWPGYDGDVIAAVNGSSSVGAVNQGTVHAGKTPGQYVTEGTLSTYGVGAPPSTNAGHTSGTAGVVMLYYSAPQCNLF